MYSWNSLQTVTLSPRIGGENPRTGARAVPAGECCPGGAGPARATRPLGHLAAGAAARLTPQHSGYFRLPCPDAAFPFPAFPQNATALPEQQ